MLLTQSCIIDDGREDGTVEDMLELLEQGTTVMMYTGDADYNCNW